MKKFFVPCAIACAWIFVLWGMGHMAERLPRLESSWSILASMPYTQYVSSIIKVVTPAQ